MATFEDHQEMVVNALMAVGHKHDWAVRWLDKLNPLLGGRTPNDVIRDGGVDFILNQIGTPESRKRATE